MTDRIKITPDAAASLVSAEFLADTGVTVEKRYEAAYIAEVLRLLGDPVMAHDVVNVLLARDLMLDHGVTAADCLPDAYPKQIILTDAAGNKQPVVVQSAADESAAKAPAPVAPAPKPATPMPLAAALPPKTIAAKEIVP